MFYKFLYALPDTDPFWDMELGGYDKKKCFANYPTLVDRDSPTQLYKNWFVEQERFWGRGNSKLYNHWKIKCTNEYQLFLNSFIETYNLLAVKNDIPVLDQLDTE